MTNILLLIERENEIDQMTIRLMAHSRWENETNFNSEITLSWIIS